MRISTSLIAAAVVSTCWISAFAQGTIVFNNGTGLIWQRISAEDPGEIPVPKGGGYVQLFWAAAGTPYTPWTASMPPAAWYFANPGWTLGPVTGFNLPQAGMFDGGTMTLSPLAPGGSIDYVVAGWLGAAQTMDEAIASSGMVMVSQRFTTATGNPATDPPGLPVPLADTFGGLHINYVPEPSVYALAVLGAAVGWILTSFPRQKNGANGRD
jgi:hypothetical protein